MREVGTSLPTKENKPLWNHTMQYSQYEEKYYTIYYVMLAGFKERSIYLLYLPTYTLLYLLL